MIINVAQKGTITAAFILEKYQYYYSHLRFVSEYLQLQRPAEFSEPSTCRVVVVVVDVVVVSS